MNPSTEKLRKRYIDNPPEGMTSKDIRSMSDEALLDMDFFSMKVKLMTILAKKDFISSKLCLIVLLQCLSTP